MVRSVLRWPYWTAAALLTYGAWFLLATAVAAWRTYTPVPVWDMWHSIVFLSGVADGSGWPVWWELMNEHRIVLTRLLFWVDQNWFNGTFIFLIVVNYVLVLAAIATLYLYLRGRAAILSWQHTVISLVVMGSWLLSWVQEQNLSWAFQSQFFLAQLLPLMGFYCLYRSTQTSAKERWFVAACTLGALSIGTMINGIMALPMMVLYAVILRMPWHRVAALTALSLICLTAYLWGYQSPGGHGSVMGALKSNPAGMLQYMVQYLGSPFQLMAKAPEWIWLGQSFGVVFLVLTLHQLSVALRSPRTHALELSLLTFVVYIAGIAFATAGGRLGFGLESALSSRYTTPTMMAWAAIGILYWPQLVALRGKGRATAVGLLVLLLILMMAVQMRGTRRTDAQHMRMMGALALVLNVHDARRTGMLIWNEGYGESLAHMAQQHGIGVLSRPPLGGALQLLGEHQNVPPAACRAQIYVVERIQQDPRFILVTGSLLADGPAPPDSVRLLDTDGTVVGIGLPERLRKRKSENGGSERLMHLTFTAYVQLPMTQLPARVVLTAPGTACSVPLTLSPPQ